jgi:hypothetical protein
MLSTIVLCEDQPTSQSGGDLAVVLARTLAALVPAKVEGILCDVRIAGPPAMGLGMIANHAGCALVEAEGEANRLHLALQAAHGPDVFLLRCGRAPEPGFIEEMHEFFAKNAKSKSPAAGLRAAPESLFERVFPSLAPIAGLIASRDLMLRMPRGGFQELARGIGPGTTFRTCARRIS